MTFTTLIELILALATLAVEQATLPAPPPSPVVAEDGSVIPEPDTYYDPCTPVLLEEGED